MLHIRSAAVLLALAGLGGLAAPALPVSAAPLTPAALAQPLLTGIRAAHHPGYDRLVFQFRGPVPAHHGVRYVDRVVGPSGKPVHVVGSATLRVRFTPAAGHDAGGRTYGPAARTYPLPGIIQVVTAEDFEGVLTFAVGVARKEPFHLFTLTGPSRVVIDLRTPFRTVAVKDYFLDLHRFQNGKPPYTRRVERPVIPPTVGFGALQRLFAGPTQAERADGLRFVASKATGFKDLRISDGVARVQLTGGCGSGGSTFTIAAEIMPALRQFASVSWVKIYDPAGTTERPLGHTDSIPGCLEP
jgi:hypothetical protein